MIPLPPLTELHETIEPSEPFDGLTDETAFPGDNGVGVSGAPSQPCQRSLRRS